MSLVKKVILTTIAGLLIIQALASYALTPEEEAIAERIRPVGEVCIEGESCLESSVPETAATNTDDNGPGSVVDNSISVTNVADTNVAATNAAENYTKTCAICHAAGVAGAPKFGSSEDWLARVAKGKEALYQSSINGFPPAMPARGMCFSCSDDDLKALVDYMVENSQ